MNEQKYCYHVWDTEVEMHSNNPNFRHVECSRCGKVERMDLIDENYINVKGNAE